MEGLDAGLGRDAVAEIEDVAGVAGVVGQDGLGRGGRGGGLAGHELGVEIALEADRTASELADLRERHGPVDAETRHAGLGERGGLRGLALGVKDDGRAGGQTFEHRTDVAQGELFVVGAGERGGPAVEDLDGVGAGGELAGEILGHGVGQDLEDAVHHLRVGLQERLGLREIFGPAAFDEIAGERPRRTGETEQGLVQAELLTQERQGVVDILQSVGRAFELQRGDVGRGAQRALHGDAAFVPETVADAQGFGDDEDVREQDRGVELREAAERLEGDLDREVGRADHRDEVRLGLERAVFRQVTAGLTHDPDRRPVMGLAAKGGEEAVAGVHQDPLSQS